MNPAEQRAKAVAFREMHRGSKILVLPNAWDCLSSRIFEQAGFPAIATTSGGIAAVLGYPDGQQIHPGEMLEMAGRIAKTVSVPVTADLEAGYGACVNDISGVMRQAMRVGIVGANLEDGRGPNQPLADISHQVEVIKSIRETANSADNPFVLNARVDVYLYGVGDDASRFQEALRRATAYRDAGADCIFLMGLRERDIIARLVREIGCPVNIMAAPGAPTISELEKIGVARVTFGTGPVRAMLPFMRRMARDLRESGGSDLLAQTEFTHATVNQLFQKRGESK
jgi:2-methylisocitrate lyase-like PEP mutase family enzyme